MSNQGKVKKDGQLVVKSDLYEFANTLESPASPDHCAELVIDAAGGVALLNLGPGTSHPAILGHVQNATLALQCSLDQLAPHTFVGEACETPANIPTMDKQSNMEGSAKRGTVAISGPDGDGSVTLHDISFAFTETYNLDGQAELLLTEFAARSETVTRGSLVLVNPRLRLSQPASGIWSVRASAHVRPRHSRKHQWRKPTVRRRNRPRSHRTWREA